MFLLDFSTKTKILYLKENIPSSKCFNDYQHIIDIIYVLFLLVSDFLFEVDKKQTCAAVTTLRLKKVT